MKIGFIGAGKMAEAMAAGLLRSGAARAADVLACDPVAARRRRMRSAYGIRAVAQPEPVVDACDVVFLAMKPQDMQAALEPVGSRFKARHLVVSIAAGRTVASIEALLPAARVVRVMPNLPAQVFQGMSVFCLGSRARAADRRTVLRLLRSVGRVMELPEACFDAVTALSGSGPAFMAYVADVLAEACVRLGLRREDALLLAEQTLLGTGALLIEQKLDPRDLIVAVTSAKGTTAAGLAVLQPSDVAGVLAETVKAAARRSRELSA